MDLEAEKILNRFLFETSKAPFSAAPTAPCTPRVPSLARATKAHAAGPGCGAQLGKGYGQSKDIRKHTYIYIRTRTYRHVYRHMYRHMYRHLAMDVYCVYFMFRSSEALTGWSECHEMTSWRMGMNFLVFDTLAKVLADLDYPYGCLGAKVFFFFCAKEVFDAFQKQKLRARKKALLGMTSTSVLRTVVLS